MKDHLLSDGPDSLISEIQGIIQDHKDEEISEFGGKIIYDLVQFTEEFERDPIRKTRQEEVEAR